MVESNCMGRFLIDLWFDELFKHITHAQIPWYLNNNARDDDGLHQFVHISTLEINGFQRT